MGAGSKLMQDAGLKKVWSTVYNENPLPKMLEGKVDSRCLRSCLLTDTTLHFTLLSGNNENEENQIFEPMQTFDNNKDVVDFVEVGNIFDYLDNDEHFFEIIDFEEHSNISSVLIEKVKSNCDDNDGLMLFNEGIVEVLRNCMNYLKNKKLVLMKHETSPRNQ